MKIYHDRILVGEIPDKRSNRTKWFQKLVGINMSYADEHLVYEGVYLPLVAIHSYGGITSVLVSNGKVPKFYMCFMPRYPWVHFERSDSIELEDA
jgi:phage gpG-like protein